MAEHVEDAIRRLLVIFGEPRVEAPAAYLRELRDSFEKLDASILSRAVDMARDNCKFFPRPAELREFAQKIAASDAMVRRAQSVKAEPELPPPTPEQKAAADKLVAEFKAKAVKFDTTPDRFIDWRECERREFEAMQRKSPNRFHRRELSPLTRRMTGESD